LAGHLRSELAETAERGQIGARESSSGARRDGSAGHVEVFQMSVQEPSSSGDLDPYPVTDAPSTSTGTTPSIVKSLEWPAGLAVSPYPGRAVFPGSRYGLSCQPVA
jgi:hypothetical protein